MAKKSARKALDKTVTNSKPIPLPIVGGDALRPLKKKKLRKQIVSPRVRKLVEILVENPDKTLDVAGKEAGYAPANAGKQASAALQSASANELFRREMARREKLCPPALATKLEQGLDATVTKYFAHEGSVMDERENVDFGSRHAYLALALRISGADPTKVDINQSGKVDVNVSVTPPILALANLTTEQLLAILELKESAFPAPVSAAPPAPIPGEDESAVDTLPLDSDEK